MEDGIELQAREARRARLLRKAAARRAEKEEYSTDEESGHREEEAAEKKFIVRKKSLPDDDKSSIDLSERDVETGDLSNDTKIFKKERRSRQLVRKGTSLDAADIAAASAIAALATTCCAFQVLCAQDGQCLHNHDPAVFIAYRRGILPLLAITSCFIVPLNIHAAGWVRIWSHARGQGKQLDPEMIQHIKFYVTPVLIVTPLTFLSYLTATIHAIVRLRRTDFNGTARSRWNRCAQSANFRGKWLKGRDGCDWNNEIQVHYKKHSNLADATVLNTEHVLIFASVLSLLFLLVFFGICLAYFGNGTTVHPVPNSSPPSSSCLDCDCLRIRPRLVNNISHHPLIPSKSLDNNVDEDDGDNDRDSTSSSISAHNSEAGSNRKKVVA